MIIPRLVAKQQSLSAAHALDIYTEKKNQTALYYKYCIINNNKLQCYGVLFLPIFIFFVKITIDKKRCYNNKNTFSQISKKEKSPNHCV